MSYSELENSSSIRKGVYDSYSNSSVFWSRRPNNSYSEVPQTIWTLLRFIEIWMTFSIQTTQIMVNSGIFSEKNYLLKSISLLLDFLWAVFQVIAIAIKNNSTRQYLIDTVRIITGVSHFAVKASPFIAEVSINCNFKNYNLQDCL